LPAITTTIILPVTGDGRAAQACIVALADNTDPDLAFELIVANASGSAEFAQFLGSIEGAVGVLTGDPGFPLAGLLRGAAVQAAAERLVIVDPRVLPAPGWLPALLAAEATAGAGALLGGVVHSSVGAVLDAGLVFAGGDPVTVAGLVRTTRNAFLEAPFHPVGATTPLLALLPRAVLAAHLSDDDIEAGWAWAELCRAAARAGHPVGLTPGARATMVGAPLPVPDPESRPADWTPAEPDSAAAFQQAVVRAQLDAGQIRFVGERAIPEAPDMDPGVMREHLVRYHDVAPRLAGRRVLDAACGSGYGSEILAGPAAAVTGVDRDHEAIAICRALRVHPDLDFVQASVTATGLPDRHFEAVVSFETIEHLDSGFPFLHEITRLLTDDGVLWLSTPLGGQVEGNHYHLSVYQRDMLLPYLREHFHEVELRYQRGDEFFDEPLTPAHSARFVDEYAIAECRRPRRHDPELVSIIIPVRNQRDLTEECLASIARNTDQSHEIILIDDASEAETAGYLQSLESATVIRNETQLGFAASINRGIRAANGAFLLLLNNDTLVTPGWLGRLIDHTRDTHIGIVGAVSNHAAEPQLYSELDYPDTAALDLLSLRLAEELKGLRLSVPKVTGLCMLIRRDLIQTIGGFDPRYGLGYCEDDDFCVRAKLAGFDIAVARDVFIHHYGSRTMSDESDNPDDRMQSNWVVFKEKWGLHLPGPSDIFKEFVAAHEQLVGRRFESESCYVPIDYERA
jgi:GT2 family glycosyltransferase/2-polyprenyl-3-methyl-5-hydroxy-6-metoxy-1,4-benzoquinol methylase